MALNKSGIAELAKSYINLTAKSPEVSSKQKNLAHLFKNLNRISTLPKLLNSSLEKTPTFDGFKPCNVKNIFYKYSTWSKFGGVEDYVNVSWMYSKIIKVLLIFERLFAKTASFVEFFPGSQIPRVSQNLPRI